MTDNSDQSVEFLLECFEKIKTNPTDPTNYAERCEAFTKLKHYYYAIEDARKIISDICPTLSLGYKLLASIYDEAEIYEEEIKVLEAGTINCCTNLATVKELLQLKQAAEKKLAVQKHNEKRLYKIFIFTGCLIGVAFALFFSKTRYLGAVMSNNMVFVSFIAFFIFMSHLIHWIYSNTKRNTRLFRIHPPYDIIDENNEIIKARDRGDFDYPGNTLNDSDDDYVDVEEKCK